MSAPALVCTFRLAELTLGLPVEDVQEVLRHGGSTRVPLAPPAVEGLLNLRGQIVTAVCLRRLLGLPPRPPAAPAMSVVLRSGAVTLVVDEVGDVLELAAEAGAPPPETVQGALGRVLRAVYRLEGHLLGVLDPDRTLELTDLAHPPHAPGERPHG
ncbi:MAG: chemotaxis protein CheW [Planctomycetota bacterium]